MLEDSDDGLITSRGQLTELFGTATPLAAKKSIPFLDRYSKQLIALSPFICIATQGDDGRADVSPRGDPPGFVKIVDDSTLAIPDRPGNNRLDTMYNILANPSVGLLFMVPGYDETLRVNGRAQITTRASLLEDMKIKDRLPKVAIVIHVDEVFLHCAKAFRRSNLWNSDAHQDRALLPSLGQMIMEQTSASELTKDQIDEADAMVESSYRNRMY